ncbi:translation initiation factor IF-2 [Candidatus Woesearchaeota archaeon]|nr:translation initiation factor IF-2 [Candidatus Woesearchaeota archaeon]
MIRAPICTFVGHVDHGKSSILDKIRGTAVTKSEAGGITQQISSSFISIAVIKKICSDLLGLFKKELIIPGLLLIDTPGHAAFSNLRKRGGNLADIAIVVIDINEGIMPQTKEAIEILRNYKTPFLIALNKIDLIPGWDSNTEVGLLNNLNRQSQSAINSLDYKLYEIVGKLYELYVLNSERFDRVEDFTKKVVLIPCSAKTGEGIPELLMFIAGISQKYLEDALKIEVTGPGEGTILEVKEEKGLGTTVDVIIYNGTIHVNDNIVIGTLGNPIVTKIRSIFIPEKGSLKALKEISAAAGVKVTAQDIKDAIAGMPLKVANKDTDSVINEIKKEVSEVLIETDKEGVVVKADSLGSLEALVYMLKNEGIKIKKASIGSINKKDISDASIEINPLNKVIIGFNVELLENTDKIRIIISNIIYRLIEDLQKWQSEEQKRLESKELETLVRPCKIKILPNCIFRQSNPAIVGVEVLGGLLRVGTPVRKENESLTNVKSIQLEKESVNEANQGQQVAISLPHITVGRQITENDILYSDIPEEDFKRIKNLRKNLNDMELTILKEIAEIKRKDNPVWGI